MTDFGIYILSVAGIFSVLYLLYRLLFRRWTFHRVNRWYLLLIMPMSFAIPFINIELDKPVFLENTDLPILLDDFEPMDTMISSSPLLPDSSWQWNDWVFVIYLLGALFLLFKFAKNIFSLLRLKQSSSSRSDGAFTMIYTDTPSVFSFFKWIFIPENLQKTLKSPIIEHEKRHAQLWHSLDLIISECFVVLLWFNPLLYLFRSDLKAIHEYQVDSELLKTDIKTSDYLQLMLDNLTASNSQVALYNYFNGLTIKKRIQMMTQEKSKNGILMTYLIIIPIVGVMVMSFSTDAIPEIVKDSIAITQEKPQQDKPKKEHLIPSISPISKGQYSRIAAGFGKRMDPIYKVMKMHNGIDLTAKEGVPILATADGIVSKVSDRKRGFGKMIILSHGEVYKTRYAHLSAFNVEQGDKVKQGDVIGYVGNTGKSSGPHLHYEVLKNNKPVDPKNYIKD